MCFFARTSFSYSVPFETKSFLSSLLIIYAQSISALARDMGLQRILALFILLTPTTTLTVKIYINDKEVDTMFMDQLRTSNHNLAFGVDNLLIAGVSQEGKITWEKFIESLNIFVHKYIVQEKIGYRFTRYETLFLRVLNIINTINQKFLKTIDDLRIKNNNFTKNKYAHINLDMVTKEIGNLQPENLDYYATILNPAKHDTQNDKDIKKMLQNVIITLQVTIQKLQIDFNKIKNDIANIKIIDALAHALYTLAPI